MLSRCLFSTLVALGVTASTPPAPPPPATYDVQVRYQINAFRNERLVRYADLMRFLKKVGFERSPEDTPEENEAEDAGHTRLRGTIASSNARRLLLERHVQALLLLPQGARLPEDKNQPVRVHLDLARGLVPERQGVLADQVRQVLAELGFKEAVGYDTRGQARLVGSIPADKLDTLLGDLRKTPGGAALPAPFANQTPLRVIEVLPDMPLPSARPAPPAVKPELFKVTADLREVIADQARAATPLRMEVLLAEVPPEGERGWMTTLTRPVPGMELEGRIGPLVTVRLRPDQVADLAALPEVAAVRLPRLGRPHLYPPLEANRDVLQESGLVRLHQMGHRGKGIRLAVLDGDFRGWEGLVGKSLTASTRLIDLTRERNRDLQADPYPGDKEPLGHGTRCALAVIKAAPEVELTLVRVDPAAPHMVQTVARVINGEPARSLALGLRQAELDEDRVALEQRLDALLKERRAVLEDFRQEEEPVKKKEKAEGEGKEEEIGPVKRRENYEKNQAEFNRDQTAYNQRLARYLQLLRDLAGLKGVRIVTSSLVWADGYPVDGSSTLSRFFDDRPFHAALWFQSAGDTRGQAWAGLFRDEDNNGVMEFAPPDAPLPEGTWTHELNFLGWRPAAGGQVLDLPAGAHVRVALQWREAHDPEYVRSGEDRYREPLAAFRLLLLSQPDPAGARQPADDLVVVAESAGLPERLDNQPGSATYEQTVELRVAKAGRFALRVEGKLPEGIRPHNSAALPFMRKTGEVRPRILVTTLAGPEGRAVWHDYVTETGSLGMPADAHRVTTVGAEDLDNRPAPFGASGPAYNLELLVKPDVWAYDQVEGARGTGPAAGFAAGLAASACSAGVPLVGLPHALSGRPGALLRAPKE